MFTCLETLIFVHPCIDACWQDKKLLLRLCHLPANIYSYFLNLWTDAYISYTKSLCFSSFNALLLFIAKFKYVILSVALHFNAKHRISWWLHFCVKCYNRLWGCTMCYTVTGCTTCNKDIPCAFYPFRWTWSFIRNVHSTVAKYQVILPNNYVKRHRSLGPYCRCTFITCSFLLFFYCFLLPQNAFFKINENCIIVK